MTLIHGDCLEVMQGMEAESVDAIVTDPPYGLEFMGKEWDRLRNRWEAEPGRYHNDTNFLARGDRVRYQAGRPMQDWHTAWAIEAFRVAKPGAHLLAFGGTRTVHRLACAIEDAGWEIRDELVWVYASGFPKSLDVSKALDKAAGAEREVTGPRIRVDGKAPGKAGSRNGVYEGFGDALPETVTAPATDLAHQWDGWGTALKPAHEPIVMARKPLVGTVAANVTRYGTGALNIGATRIPSSAEDAAAQLRANTPGAGRYADTDSSIYGMGEGLPSAHRDHDPSNGRWPPNLLLDSEHPELFDQPNPYVVGSGVQTAVLGHYRDLERIVEQRSTFVGHNQIKVGDRAKYAGDSGGYSRFFIVPKAGRAEREAGLQGMATRATHPLEEAKFSTASNRRCTVCGLVKFGKPHCTCPEPVWEESAKRANTHPTVKPLTLMRHLVKLVTPPGGIVLDPFLGSGTTGIAAEMEGFSWIGIEKEAEYVKIAQARINGTQRGLGLDVPAPTPKPPSTHPDLAKHQPKVQRRPTQTTYGKFAGFGQGPDE